jgi:hypothetical protein
MEIAADVKLRPLDDAGLATRDPAEDIRGIEKKRFLVAVEAISSIGEDQVRLGQARERIEGGPPYDPEIVEKEDYATIYNYDGYAPFWDRAT